MDQITPADILNKTPEELEAKYKMLQKKIVKQFVIRTAITVAASVAIHVVATALEKKFIDDSEDDEN